MVPNFFCWVLTIWMTNSFNWTIFMAWCFVSNVVCRVTASHCPKHLKYKLHIFARVSQVTCEVIVNNCFFFFKNRCCLVFKPKKKTTSSCLVKKLIVHGLISQWIFAIPPFFRTSIFVCFFLPTFLLVFCAWPTQTLFGIARFTFNRFVFFERLLVSFRKFKKIFQHFSQRQNTDSFFFFSWFQKSQFYVF